MEFNDIDDELIPIHFYNILYNNNEEKENENIMDLFKKIESKKLLIKDNALNNAIFLMTDKIYIHLEESIKTFHFLFNKNLKNFEDCLKYLEKSNKPDNCVCAGVIDNISGWRCVNCSKYDNAIYCNDCYKKSKDLHKGHRVFFLPFSNGMCDCGDPDCLSTFCPEHSGPYSDKIKIDEYLTNVFGEDILDKLNNFFEGLFFQFSKYFILTEKCDSFISEFYRDIANNNSSKKDEEKDINSLKNDFSIIFQNLLHFLRLLSENNIGMLHLIANHLLESQLEKNNIQKEYFTTHRCIKITKNDIQLLYTNKEEHNCVCPFFRLLLTNYRNNIDSYGINNKEFFLSFSHNLPLRTAFCILYFSQYKQIILNDNEMLLQNRHQFFNEDATELMAKKTHLLEEQYDILYQLILKNLNSKTISNFAILIECLKGDIQYFSTNKMRDILTEKTIIVKRVIDIICLIHNKNEIKSIFPHPQFQNKGYSSLFKLENALINLVEEINIFINWEKTEQVKEIFKYIINKILNQEKEGIKQLQKNEYSFHLVLYRCFGLFLNSFCFNYAFERNICNIIDTIKIFKQNFFETQEQVSNFVEIILNDYFKFFGFIAGIKNNYFNYYDSLINYSNKYFSYDIIHITDFSLLKYLLVMQDNKRDIISYFQKSNIEKVFSSFENIFALGKNSQELNNENDSENIENSKDKKEITEDDKNVNNNNNNHDQGLPSFDNNNNNNDIGNISDDEYINNNINIQRIRNRLQRLANRMAMNDLINNISIKDEKIQDEYNCIMQWKLLLEILIKFLKDDSCIFWNLMNNYIEIVIPNTQKELFNRIKRNKFAIKDLENILKEKLVHKILANENLVDIKDITQSLDKFLIVLFENDKLNETLNEIADYKLKEDSKLYYLKDSSFKYIDMNYYFSSKEKSMSERYILDFKKDIIKLYNSYYFNPSELTFEFFESVYEKILLNKDNLELMIKIVEKLLISEKITENLDKKSVINALLPTILNYLSMFAVINTKSFIEFKIENKAPINKLIQILKDSLESNKNDEILDKDFEENIKQVINQLKRYEQIYESLNNDLSKLEKYDYNTEILEKLKQNNNNLDKNNINLFSDDTKKINEQNKKSKNMKNKFKNLMKKKADLFMDKIRENKEIIKQINEQQQNIKESKDEIMCFYCRNPIDLNSFEVPYGKLGLLIQDFFYMNCIKSTIRKELKKLVDKEENFNKIYDGIIKNFTNEKLTRITSCGHYFHTSCFIKGCKKNYLDYNEFACPLCLKKQNILIPPLIRFKEKYLFLKSIKINELIEKNEPTDSLESNKDIELFKEILINFLSLNNFLINRDHKDFSRFLDDIFPYFKSHFNYLENIFYIDGTTFNKQQQIDNLQNIILSLRASIKLFRDFNIKQIINYVLTEITNLIKGPDKNNYIYNQKYMHMHYIISLEKIFLSLAILFDYEEIDFIFKYILYMILPYFAFGYYYRDLVFKKQINNIGNFKLNEKMNMNALQEYLKENNKQIIYYFQMLLRKLCLIKLLMDFKNKNEHIIHSFSEMRLENLLSLVDKDNSLYKLLTENGNKEFYFWDFLNFFPKIFDSNDLFYKHFEEIENLDHKKIFESIFYSTIKNNNENASIVKELIIQFSPIKFEFTFLENDIFDFIEKNLEKKCDICNNNKKFFSVCLICGNRVCSYLYDNHVIEHLNKCCGETCLFLDIKEMKLIVYNSQRRHKELFALYVNESGSGPEGIEIGNEFNLSREKLNISIKNYVCNEFNFND